MKKYSGRLDGLFGPIVRGWVMPADGGAEKPTVSLFVDGKVIGRVAADQRRVDLIVKGVGDGCHGFSFDLRSAPRIADDALIVVSVEDVEAPMPLGAVKVGSEADGRIERLDNGWLIGWAHGPRFRPVRLGIYRNGVLAVAWPCNHVRGDLAAKGIGSGRHGFRIPLEDLLPQSPHTTLTFRLLPGDLVLPPCQPMQDSSVLQPRLRLEALGEKAVDVRQLKAAVIECLVNGKDLATSDDAVLIAPALLNEILNRLSAAEASAVTFDQHVAFKRTATERPPASAAQSDKRRSWQGSIGANLAAIVERSEHFGGDEIVAQIEKDIMPTYRDSLIERKYLAAAIETLDDPKLLRALTTAFRKHDFYHVPIEAYRRSLDFAPSVDPSNFKYLNIISGWSRGDQLTSPQHLKPIAVAQRKRKRVLYVLWRSVPYDTNGYATRSHYLLRSFRQIGQDVVAATRFGYPWDAEHKKSAQAHTEVIDDVLYIHHGGSNASRDTLSLDEYVSECAERLAMTAASVGADIIHSASNWVAALPALRAARLLGLPFCYEIRGLWEVTRASNVPGYDKTDHYELFRNMEGYVARQADQVFAITRQVMAEMGRRGADTSRMLLAPNGVELERFSPKSIDRELATSLGITNEVVFGYIGTFAKYEGLLDLCIAATQLRKARSDFKVLLVGDGPVFSEVQAYCKAHDDSGCIILRERVPFADVPRYYSLIDIAVFPRTPNEITEMVSPLKPFEAMAMGKPVIGSDVEAIAEIIQHDRTGWLFEKGNVAALKDVLETSIDRRSDLPGLGRTAREFVAEHHDWRVIARRIADGWTKLRPAQ